QYQEMSYRLTLLEMQKLAYFLQVAGEPLKLNFEKGKYGPYAQNLNYVLERIEGHFIRGYGDSQKHDQEIELIDGAAIKAEQLIKNNPDANKQLKKVADLIEGFETPYGMELLSSTHWIAREMETSDEQIIISGIQSWNDRKKRMFQEKHIRISRERLIKENWI
ncbi:Appr-1-p processing protein, partial [bacterium]|nr:Appr-1-p processing protein [bacterium]